MLCRAMLLLPRYFCLWICCLCYVFSLAPRRVFLSEALQARALEPARCTPARGCCNQCVPCTRTQTRTDACRHMHQHANLPPVVSEEPRPHLACQLPQPARIAKASFLQCGFQTCSRRSLRPSKKKRSSSVSASGSMQHNFQVG